MNEILNQILTIYCGALYTQCSMHPNVLIPIIGTHVIIEDWMEESDFYAYAGNIAYHNLTDGSPFPALSNNSVTTVVYSNWDEDSNILHYAVFIPFKFDVVQTLKSYVYSAPNAPNAVTPRMAMLTSDYSNGLLTTCYLCRVVDFERETKAQLFIETPSPESIDPNKYLLGKYEVHQWVPNYVLMNGYAIEEKDPSLFLYATGQREVVPMYNTDGPYSFLSASGPAKGGSAHVL